MMEGTDETEQSQTWKNLMRLVDFSNFVELSSAVAALLRVDDPNENSFMIPGILQAPSILFFYLLTMYDDDGFTICKLLAESVFMLFIEFLPGLTKNLVVILLASCILLIISVLGLCCIGLISYWRKQFPGLVDFGFVSARIQLLIIKCLILFFINGCTILYVWLTLQDGGRVIGFMLIGIQGLLGIFCCISRIFYVWRMYGRSGALVSSVASNAEA